MTRKPFIVAEMSANHLQDYKRAVRIVEAAAAAGADAIKLQTWEQDKMVLDPTLMIDHGRWAGRSMMELYRECWTPWAWHAPLFELAKKLGLVAFSSAFDIESVGFLESLGCPIHKVSSFEITDKPLIEAMARTDKPMMISTGMATVDEIWTAHGWARSGGTENITMLHCTSAYPADCKDANLWAITNNPGWGISDHTHGIGVAVAATALGAEVVEKHLTLSRSDGGPDQAFSMEPHEFTAMVQACRDASDAISTHRDRPTAEEERNLVFRRGVYAAQDIKAGDTLTLENVRTARPAGPQYTLQPHQIAQYVGYEIGYDVPAGTPITQAMFRTRTNR